MCFFVGVGGALFSTDSPSTYFIGYRLKSSVPWVVL